jgi:hypothetical protein
MRSTRSMFCRIVRVSLSYHISQSIALISHRLHSREGLISCGYRRVNITCEIYSRVVVKSHIFGFLPSWSVIKSMIPHFSTLWRRIASWVDLSPSFVKIGGHRIFLQHIDLTWKLWPNLRFEAMPSRMRNGTLNNSLGIISKGSNKEWNCEKEKWRINHNIQ